MADRVDKNWQKTGLTPYSTESILGTLAHYGLQVDEAGFRTLSKDAYPLAIASEWHKGWKGTGQFARYPFAAAQELWKRWLTDRILPSALAEAVGKVVLALSQKLAGKGDAPVATAFGEFEAIRAKIPVKDGGAAEKFVEEGFALLGKEMMQAFDELAERLAQEGHLEEAKTFAVIEEFLIPTRAGVVSALVRGASGEREPAVLELEKLAAEPTRDGFGRLSAVDGLIHLGSDKARALAETLLEDAEKKEDHHLAMAVVERLVHVLEKTSDAPGIKALADRAQKIHAAHGKAHPHHGH